MRIFSLQSLTEFLNLQPEEQKKIEEISLEMDLSFFANNFFQRICNVFSQCEALETLQFKEDILYKLSTNSTRLIDFMQALVPCKKLSEIILAANQIGTWNNPQLLALGKGLLKLQSLKTLSLAYNSFDKLKASGFKVFFRTLAQSSVEKLDLEGNGLGTLNLPCLSAFGWALILFKHLHVLSLARNRLKPEEDSYFEILRASKTLCEIEGIQEFTVSHLEELNEIMFNNEQPIINREVQLLPPPIKTLIFSYCYSELPSPPSLHSDPEFTENANVKRHKTE